MRDYTASTYGDHIAARYDDLEGSMDPAACVEFLAGLAGVGPALELGIGTGRVALPLAARGVEVHGLDASRKMVAKMRAKKGGKRIPVTFGDFRDVPVAGEFALVYVVFNTFFSLLTQEDQVRCFAAVARRLRPGGVFVIEAFVPDPTRFDRHQRTETFGVGVDYAHVGVNRYDPVGQVVSGQHIEIVRGRVKAYPLCIRFAWPSELDLMARLAGLHLRERHGGWRREPFTAASGAHVSVYERPGD
jgi:SAM-dependent methyltransferase